MIATTVSDLLRYKGLGENLDRAIDWVLEGSWKTWKEDGKLPIDGDKVFAVFMHYDSKLPQEALFETHRNHIDIQMLLEGEELVEVRKDEALQVAVPYVDDIEMQHVPDDRSHVCVLKPGSALILFPEDAHRPSMASDGVPRSCHKMVLKVLI